MKTSQLSIQIFFVKKEYVCSLTLFLKMSHDSTIDERLYKRIVELCPGVNQSQMIELLRAIAHGDSDWFKLFQKQIVSGGVSADEQKQVVDGEHETSMILSVCKQIIQTLAKSSPNAAAALHILIIRAIRYGRRPGFVRVYPELADSLTANNVTEQQCLVAIGYSTYPRMAQLAQRLPAEVPHLRTLALLLSHPKEHAVLRALLPSETVIQPEKSVEYLRGKYGVTLPLLVNKFTASQETQEIYESLASVCSHPSKFQVRDKIKDALSLTSSPSSKIADIYAIATEHSVKKTDASRLVLIERCLRFGSPNWLNAVVKSACSYNSVQFVVALFEAAAHSRDHAAVAYMFVTALFNNMESTQAAQSLEFRSAVRPISAVVVFGSRLHVLSRELSAVGVKPAEKDYSEFNDTMKQVTSQLTLMCPRGFALPEWDGKISIVEYVDRCLKTDTIMKNHAAQSLLLLKLEQMKSFVFGAARNSVWKIKVDQLSALQLRVRPDYQRFGISRIDTVKLSQTGASVTRATGATSVDERTPTPVPDPEPSVINKDKSREAVLPAVLGPDAKTPPKLKPWKGFGPAEFELTPENALNFEPVLDSTISFVLSNDQVLVLRQIDDMVQSAYPELEEDLRKINEDFTPLAREFMLGPMGQHVRDNVSLDEYGFVDCSMGRSVLDVYHSQFPFDPDCLYLWFGVTNNDYIKAGAIPDLTNAAACIQEARMRLVRIDPKDIQTTTLAVKTNVFTPIGAVTAPEQLRLSFRRENLSFYSVYESSADGMLLIFNMRDSFMPQKDLDYRKEFATKTSVDDEEEEEEDEEAVGEGDEGESEDEEEEDE